MIDPEYALQRIGSNRKNFHIGDTMDTTETAPPVVTCDDVRRIEEGEEVILDGYRLGRELIVAMTVAYDYDEDGKLRESSRAGVADCMSRMLRIRRQRGQR
jgi:hypothetical protein